MSLHRSLDEVDTCGSGTGQEIHRGRGTVVDDAGDAAEERRRMKAAGR